MTTLLIGNTRTREMVGDLTRLTPQARDVAGHGSHRMLWWAKEGDVLVLPTAPDEPFADYVAALTGTPRGSLTVLTPAPGRLGDGLLTPDRLADAALHEALRDALGGLLPRASRLPGPDPGRAHAGRPAEGGRSGLRITPVYADTAVADLAHALGAASALPGHAFHAQGGSALVNSKAAFRAVAAGAGVPTAPGTVAAGPDDAVRAVTALLEQGHCAMAKREFSGGGLGNDILAPAPGVRSAGAPRTLVLGGREAVEKYVAESWPWLTEDGRHRLVVERYYEDAVAVYAEFEVRDDTVALTGTGEMLMDPVVVGEIVPALATLPAEAEDELVGVGRRLCEAYRAMGYRGTISADAYRTPDGAIRFSEANGRITGSTHLHTVVGDRLLGPARKAHRVLVSGDCPAPPFPQAARALARAGLGYDPADGTGAVLVNHFGPAAGAVLYCVVAGDLTEARERQRDVEALLAATTV